MFKKVAFVTWIQQNKYRLVSDYNNALIPVGLIVNLVIWNKEADKKILIGGSLISLFALNEYVKRNNI
jgi:hypothetical protein